MTSTRDTIRTDSGHIDPRASLLALVAEAVPAWTENALCAQVDPELFFPDKGGSVREAKAVCAACPVRGQCLEYAMEHETSDTWPGVYGGLSSKQRRVLRRNSLGDKRPVGRPRKSA